MIKGTIDGEHPISGFFNMVLMYYNQGDIENRDAEMAKILMLVRNLNEIEQYDSKLLKKFRKDFNNNKKSNDNYYGFRFEVNITANLIRKKVTFKKTESPDFKIAYSGMKLGIECGSSHLCSDNIEDLKTKVGSVIINEKSGKPYNLPTTALFIDITNLNYHSLIKQSENGHDDLTNTEVLKEYILNLIKSNDANVSIKYGSIILFTYMINKDLNRFQQNYIRIDNPNIDETLLHFLNEYYPFGEVRIKSYSVPSKG